MAMSAAAALVMMLMVVVATAFAVVAAAALVAHLVQYVLNLLISGLTVLQHDASKLQCLPSQRMVGVDGHTVLLNLLYASHEAMLLLVHQRDDGARIDIVVVEVAVDGEHLALQLVHALLQIFAEGLGWRQGEVELLARLHVDEALLEAVEREAEAADKRERLSLLCLFLQMGLAVIVYGVELIAH